MDGREWDGKGLFKIMYYFKSLCKDKSQWLRRNHWKKIYTPWYKEVLKTLIWYPCPVPKTIYTFQFTPNDLKLLYFLRFNGIKEPVCILWSKRKKQLVVAELTVFCITEVSINEKYAKGLVGEHSDMMWRNSGGLFVKVRYGEFPAHHYRQFAP